MEVFVEVLEEYLGEVRRRRLRLCARSNDPLITLRLSLGIRVDAQGQL